MNIDELKKELKETTEIISDGVYCKVYYKNKLIYEFIEPNEFLFNMRKCDTHSHKVKQLIKEINNDA